ncbi:hypothetical protein PanWU01x14_074580 [Parasponia andersonii]|uniref:TPR1-like CTLH-containing domain-containing protein n=1 Tax=Parasponia andersonii TaxID=3476 RepID=A0A2P5DDE9_PARAD|nr:hypothetical protein PanWU01x14_074580 [Parasponia andersonii]
MEELKTFQRYNDNLIPEATHLLTLDNFRTYHSLREYEDIETERITMMKVIKIWLEANPLLHGQMQPLLFDNNKTAVNTGPPPNVAPLSVSPFLNLALNLSSGFF